jgi:hypothetical protein
LQGSLRIDGAVAGDGAECAVRDGGVRPCKGMAVESIREFYFENQHMRLEDGSTLDQRKVFIEIRLTSDRSGNSGQVSEQEGTGLAIFGSKVLIEKGSAIEISIGTFGYEESRAAGVRGASAIGVY